ncbi:MAG: TAT-variant-translocated molybdopterin oxidoreductase [Planctomycetota bacterium]
MGGAANPDGYWRSLSELRGEASFEEQFLHREFPVAASEYPEGVSRRRWMELMGASMALVGAAAGCRYPEEKILPFVIRPEGRIPGERYLRASNFELAGRVYNLLVSCVDGRPIKIEANPEHPGETGTDAYAQASILTLYDPDRARSEDDRVILRKGDGKVRQKADWSQFLDTSRILVNSAAEKNGGGGVAVLMGPTSSPTQVRMLGELRKKLPKATFAKHDSVSGDALVKATSAVFGAPARQVLCLDEADIVLTLQADVLGNDPGTVQSSSTFAKRRDPINGTMNRLYVVEGGYTGTGASADARLALQPSQIPGFLTSLKQRVEEISGGKDEYTATGEVPYDQLGAPERLERFLDQVARDIAEAGERAVVIVGDAAGADAIQAGIAMNAQLGSLGKAQKFLPRVDTKLGDVVDLKTLAQQATDGKFEALIILDGNPAFSSPADVNVAAMIAACEQSIYLGEYDDETSVLCDWSAPVAHPLESWGDCISDSGHYGVCQPHILPLLGGRSVPEILAGFLGMMDGDGEVLGGQELVRRTAAEVAGSMDRGAWRKLLHDGFLADVRTSFLAVPEAIDFPDLNPALQAVTEVDKDQLEILFVASDGLYDGRFANNGWLQELPQTLTAMSWDNAAIMSPATAKAIGIKHGQKVALGVGDARIEMPVYEIPGCAPGVVTLPIGYGRTRAGRVGGFLDFDIDVVGFDVRPIRFSENSLHVAGVKGRPRYDEYEISTTQNHWAIDELGRKETAKRSFSLVREGTTALLEKIPQFAESKGPHVPTVGPDGVGSLWEEPIDVIEKTEDKVPQWGMTVDLTKCTGCNACVVACQSENNVPIVGREQVMKSREMHWLRMDRYFQGNEENADVVMQPVSCMHCETAPCEQVCPVAATVHTDEGLNAMAYNRCIGTRYCANNCPYKVRRFNYFNYNEEVGVGYGWNAFPSNIESADRRLESLSLNPEVTVRGRGVMEKCTYCVQRIEAAKITARRETQGIVPDGAIQTACQAACPAKAMEFGNLKDPESAVSKKRKDVRSYGLLAQLNLKPRTEYLARVRNTPYSLMTAKQIEDLETLKAPHHHGGDHGHGDHGHDGHGHGDHGHDDHGHGDHSHDDHGHDDHGHGDHGHGEAKHDGEKAVDTANH